MVRIKLPTPLFLWFRAQLGHKAGASIQVNIQMEHGVTHYTIEPKDPRKVAGRVISQPVQAA